MNEKSCPHCGGVLGKHRSLPDHRRFFALISAAHAQWPHDHDFKPDSVEHLRKWLITAAGHRDVVEIAVPETEDQPALARLVALSMQSALEAAGAYAFVRPDPNGGRVAVYKPRSIAWDTITQREFSEIRSAVEDVIEREVGVSAEDLLREKAA